MTDALILASTSRFRAAILKNAGVEFHSEDPGVDEAAVKAGLPAMASAELASHLAEAKALAVSRRFPTAMVIGSDQVLDCAGDVFSKPGDLAEARLHLERLRGREHALLTAVCLARGGAVAWTFCDLARLTMRPFSDSFLTGYLTMVGSDACKSVGAYQLEGPGAQLFSRVEGDYFSILGLPLLPLLAQLRGAGLVEA